VLRAPEFFHVFVGGVLPAAEIGIHHFRQNLRTLALDPMARRVAGAIVTRKSRQHQEQRLRRPERQENLEKKTFQTFAT